MLYMVIERYLSGAGPVYERAAARGRMLPEGLVYLNSFEVYPVLTSAEAAARAGT
jgi:hypothetical protein